MGAFLFLCWRTLLIAVLSFGFEDIIWLVIVPVTVSVAHLPWLEFVVRLCALVCSILFATPIKLLGGRQ